MHTLLLEVLFFMTEFLEPSQVIAFIASRLRDIQARINLNLNLYLDKNQVQFNGLCERQGV